MAADTKATPTYRDLDDGSVEVLMGDETPPNPNEADDDEGDGDEGRQQDTGTDTDDGDGTDDSATLRNTDDGDRADSDQTTGTDADRQSKREARRHERQAKRQRIREREDTLRAELRARDSLISELSNRLSQVEQGQAGSQIAQMELALGNAQRAVDMFQRQIAAAQQANDGAALADATRRMLQAQQDAQQIDFMVREARQAAGRPAPTDPRVLGYAQEFQRRHPWYKHGAPDPDSRLVTSLDNMVAQQGFIPSTPAYWQELERHMKRYGLIRSKRQESGRDSDNPPSDNDEDDAPPARNTTRRRPGPRTGGSDDTGGEGGGSTYRLSADRVKAMKDAGLWDDPKERADAIRRYRQYDRDQQNSTRR